MAEETPLMIEEAPPIERRKPKDKWDKWERVAKIIGGISIPIIGVAATITLGVVSEHNRNAQFKMNLIQAREAADTDIRAKMFDFLLTRYFTVQSGPVSSVEDFQTRRMVLRLLLENFQEHFSTKALYAHLYQQAKNAETKAVGDAKKQWQTFKEELIQVGRNTTTEQLISLAPVALMATDIFLPVVKEIDLHSPNASQHRIETRSLRVALYPTQGLTGTEFLFQPSEVHGQQGNEHGGSETPRYSITLSVKEIKEDAATINVWIHEDKYIGKKFDAVHSPALSHFQFDASYFSTPYTENTLLPDDGSRFSVIYKGCMDKDEKDFTCRFPLNPNHHIMAQFDVVTFKANLITRRDRPDVDKMLETIRKKDWVGLF